MWDWAIGAGFGGVVYGDFFPGFGFWMKSWVSHWSCNLQKDFFFFWGGGVGGERKKGEAICRAVNLTIL